MNTIQEPRKKRRIQFRLTVLLAFVAVVATLFALWRAGQLLQLRTVITTAGSVNRTRSGYQARKFRARLFRQASNSRLQELIAHPHHTIALHAAWERVRRTVPKRPLGTRAPPDPKALDQFLGFVRSRFGTVPSWWEAVLQKAQTGVSEDILRMNKPAAWPFSPVPFDWSANPDWFVQSDWQLPDGTSIEQMGNAYVLTVGDEVAHVPADVIEAVRAEMLLYGLSAVITNDKCFLAFSWDVCWPYELICIDRHEGKVLWTTTIWAGGDVYGFRGEDDSWHGVTVREWQDQILVFGVGSDAAYIEGFKMSDGSNTFRFCTQY